MTTPEARYQRLRQSALVVWTSIGVLVLLAVALWGLGKIAGALIPFVIAFIVAFLLNWPVRELSRRGMTRGMAAAICLTLGFLVLGVAVSLMGPFIGRQVGSFAQSAPEHFAQLEATATALQAQYAEIVFPQWLAGFITAASARLSALAVTLGDQVAGALVSTGSGVATGFFDFVLAIVIASKDHQTRAMLNHSVHRRGWRAAPRSAVAESGDICIPKATCRICTGCAE